MVRNLKKNKIIRKLKFRLKKGLDSRESLRFGLLRIQNTLIDLITPDNIDQGIKENNIQAKPPKISNLYDNLKKEAKPEIDKFEYELIKLGSKLKKVFDIEEKSKHKKAKSRYSLPTLKNKLRRNTSEDLLRLGNEFSELHKDASASISHYKLKTREEVFALENKLSSLSKNLGQLLTRKKSSLKIGKNKLRRNASEDLLRLGNEFSELHKDARSAVKYYKSKARKRIKGLETSLSNRAGHLTQVIKLKEKHHNEAKPNLFFKRIKHDLKEDIEKVEGEIEKVGA